MKPIHIGCSGWNYADWRERVYPRGVPPSRWLQHYAGLFDTVEVNSTFYRLASRNAVAAWVEQTPPDFLFALKASRYLTHMKRLSDMDSGVHRFYERIEPLVDTPKMGPIVWQLPASFHRDDERLGNALDGFPPRPSLLRVSPPELVCIRCLCAAARAQRRAGDRRPP